MSSDQYKAAVGHLRHALNGMVEAHPCGSEDPACHCPTCVSRHALSATGLGDDGKCGTCGLFLIGGNCPNGHTQPPKGD